MSVVYLLMSGDVWDSVMIRDMCAISVTSLVSIMKKHVSEMFGWIVVDESVVVDVGKETITFDYVDSEDDAPTRYKLFFHKMNVV